MPKLIRPFAFLASLPRLALVPALLFALACSGGGSGGDIASSGDTGSVGVLLTDSPTDEFLQLLVEVTKVELLGAGGHVTLFEDPAGREFDLLSLRDEARVIGLGRRVPVGDWTKIRLQIQNARLVRAVPDADPKDEVPCPPDVDPQLVCEAIVLDVPTGKRPGGGKLDLNPRGTIPVRAGELLLVKLDMDANKSLHLAKTGSGRHILRPLVFVDIFTRRAPERLVLLEGSVEEVDPAAGTFQLCDGHSVFDASEGERRHRQEMTDDDRCIEVRVDDETAIFDPDGLPLELGDLEGGSQAAVLGRFRLDAGEALRFDAEVVQIGGRDAVDRIAGEVIEPVVPLGGDFTIAPDPDGPVGTEPLPIRLLEGAKIFSRSGEPLELADIRFGQRVRAFGWLVLPQDDTPSFDAAVVFVDTEGQGPSETVLRGEVTAPFDPATGTFEVWPDASSVVPRCVAIGPDGDVFRVSEMEDMLRSERILPADLEVGERVDVFGEGGDRCFRADTVISLGKGG